MGFNLGFKGLRMNGVVPLLPFMPSWRGEGQLYGWSFQPRQFRLSESFQLIRHVIQIVVCLCVFLEFAAIYSKGTF